MNSKFLNDYWPLIVAVKEGKVIQVQDPYGNWHNLPIGAEVYPDQGPCRIKPEPELVPMEEQDFPAVFWLMFEDDNESVMPTSIGQEWVVVDGVYRSYSELMSSGVKYSTDRKTWKPCSKEKKTVADIIKGKSDACIAHAHEKGIPHDTLNFTDWHSRLLEPLHTSRSLRNTPANLNSKSKARTLRTGVFTTW